MKTYFYLQNGAISATTLTEDKTREELVLEARKATPKCCPFFILDAEELAALETVPIEAITFDEAQADGYGEAE